MTETAEVRTATGPYQKFVAETAIFPRNFGLIYCALKLAGEAGEVVEKIGKLIRDAGALRQDRVVVLTTAQIDGIKQGARAVYLDDDQIKGVTPHLELTDEQNLGLVKELGDVEWYLTALARELGTTKDAVLAVNVKKLTDRRARNTLSGSGDDR